ncbi:MAG: LysR family transcriptional regulator [Paracoccaceae bacterium]
MNSTLLRGFLAISKYKNLTRAAQEMCCTQSTLSLQLKKLEVELGVKLFERGARGMSITVEGQRLLPLAVSISSDMSEIGALFGNKETIELKIGIPDDFEGKLLEIALWDFGQEYPDVHVTAMAGCTSEFESEVRRDELDMAIISGPRYKSNTPFCQHENYWVCKQDSAVHRIDPLPLAMLERSCWWQDMVSEALNQQGRNWHTVFSSPSFGVTLSAIRSGRAVGILPASLMQDNFQILSDHEGFLKLPDSFRSVVVAEKASQEHVAAMSSSLQNAHRQVGGACVPT